MAGNQARPAAIDQPREVLRLARDEGQAERREFVPRTLGAALRVDRDHARSGADRSEQQGHRSGAVAQQDADARAGLRQQGGERIDGGREVAPRPPAAFELERRRRRIERQDGADPLRERVHGLWHQRILGERFGCGARAASALPIGLPSRV
jgi:hypothetical protein